MRITTKGQVTIPQDIRERLGLLPNTEVTFDVADGEARLRNEPLPYEAGFLAGKAFVAYRKRGGAKRSPMPDFCVGAHAVVGGMALLTRDAARYRTYVPALPIVAP